MQVTRNTSRSTKAAWWLLATVFVCVPFTFAIEPAVPSSVDIYWKSTRVLIAPGVSTVVVLDENVAHAQLGSDTIEFAGLTRGDTVALAYVNGAPISIVVHVIDHPVKMIPPSLLRRQAEMAQGFFGSDVQTSSGSNSSFSVLDSFSWVQRVGDQVTSFNSQLEHNTQFGGPTTNLRTGGLSYRTPGMSLSFLDFSQSLTGAEAEDRINNFSSTNNVELRGASLTLERGQNQYSFFGGTTIPYRFLSLNATRDVAGFGFHRKQTDKLSLYGGTSFVNIPLALDTGVHRRSYLMQTAGVSYRLSKGFVLGGQAGISNGAGKLLRADASYTSYRLVAYASAILASQTFPLSQLQSLFSGTSAVKSAVSYRMTSRLTEGVYYEHTNVAPGLVYRLPGSSDYLSPNFSFVLSPSENLGFSYTYSRSIGGFSPAATTSGRYDFSLGSRLSARIANTAQLTIGSIQDPLQISSQDQFTIRDSISLPIKGQTLLLGIEHDRTQPSLLSKLNQEIDLLSPALQAEFRADPAGFIDSSNFPPEVKALLAAQQPIGTTVSASTTLSLGARLRFNPNVAITHSSQGNFANSWTQSFGYSLAYQLTPTLQIRSSLSNILLWDLRQNSAQRNTLLSFGFLKNFSAAPGALSWARRSRIIEGRVFRDNNINGAFNLGEPGLAGIEVRLEDGQVAITDEQGRYKFPSVSADQHQVSLELTQFRHPVRMTTHSEAQADVIQQRIAILNFGILDFARVMGNVYNDLRFDNRRQPDSKGMQAIELLLENGSETRKIQTTGSGEFEFDNVSPGDYKLSIDATSLPANYAAPSEAISIHVSPVSTVVEDLPTRALRSISGRLLLKLATTQSSEPAAALPEKRSRNKSRNEKQTAVEETKEEFTLVPVTGALIIAGPSSSMTDKEGNFLLRNLPAGDLNVTIRPVKAVPAGINIPTGAVKLPAEPVQIQGATIVITNADLLPYLTRDFPSMPGQREQRVVAEKAAPVRQEKPVPIAKSTDQPKPAEADAQPAVDSQPVSTRTISRTPSTPAVPDVVIPAQVRPVISLPRVPDVFPSAPAVSRATLRRVAPTNVGSVSSVRNLCEGVTSLGEAARCIKEMKQNAAIGTLQ